MPVIKVWGMPDESDAHFLRTVRDEIKKAVLSVSELRLTNRDITIIFPKELSLGMGKEIIIEVTGLVQKPERTWHVKECLAKQICEAVWNIFQVKVEVFVQTFNTTDGFWTFGG